MKKSRKPWEKAARLRRLLIGALILSSSFFASLRMADVLPHGGGGRLEVAIVAVFAILFAWISIGFWEAIVGLFTLVRGKDRFAVWERKGVGPRPAEKPGIPLPPSAILFPISNEEVARVFAGLRATYESLLATDEIEPFHFFILSDSSDPDRWVEEEVAWAELCQSLGLHGRLFYRRRRVNLKRKSGNIADFCRRWGRNYRYMFVLDADSVMAGEAIVRMARIMEANPEVGILQTAPKAVNQETTLARGQQFANHVYGPVFTAGLHFLQLGDSHFWGHNAIIRVEPFMKHCGLPQLPGKPPLGGYILSHDFVEAAFMRRGGWEVWLLHDQDGSYEEVPATLLDELKRDRRWCQGNLQHVRLLFRRGLLAAHRALFLHGVMSYVSALLWCLFIGLSSAEAILEAFRTPVYFTAERTLFPNWPVWHPKWALTLLSTTGVILFMPKLLSVLLIALKGKAHLFGGPVRLLAGLIGEVALSAFFAPIRMFFQTKFVLLTLLGRQIGWSAQKRTDPGTGWSEALRFHGAGVAAALIWGGLLFLLNRSFFWWNAPIFLPLLLAVPLSVWSSSPKIGKSLQRLGLFLIPEEIETPKPLRTLDALLGRTEPLPHSDRAAPKPHGFVRAVTDPNVNALHRSLLRKERMLSRRIALRRLTIQEKAMDHGPEGLSAAEKRELLSDPARMLDLHQKIWETHDPSVADIWELPP
jgi:membrane glycosyltransferase